MADRRWRTRRCNHSRNDCHYRDRQGKSKREIDSKREKARKRITEKRKEIERDSGWTTREQDWLASAIAFLSDSIGQQNTTTDEFTSEAHALTFTSSKLKTIICSGTSRPLSSFSSLQET